MTTDLMRIASAGQLIAREHHLAHDDAEGIGANYESREERQERQHRERTEDALVASAELEDAAQGRWDREDRAWREAHPQTPSEDELKRAHEYMDLVAQMRREEGA